MAKPQRFPCQLRVGITADMAAALEMYEMNSMLSMQDIARMMIIEGFARRGLNVGSSASRAAPAHVPDVEERV